MAQKKKEQPAQKAVFRSAETAAVFGVTEKDEGTVTYCNRGIVTVEFSNARAERVSAELFNITDNAQAVIAAPVEVSDEGSN